MRSGGRGDTSFRVHPVRIRLRRRRWPWPAPAAPWSSQSHSADPSHAQGHHPRTPPPAAYRPHLLRPGFAPSPPRYRQPLRLPRATPIPLYRSGLEVRESRGARGTGASPHLDRAYDIGKGGSARPGQAGPIPAAADGQKLPAPSAGCRRLDTVDSKLCCSPHLLICDSGEAVANFKLVRER